MAKPGARLLTQVELADLLGCTPGHLRDLSMQGLLPRDERSRRYPMREAVRAYIDYIRGKARLAPDEALDYNKERAALTRWQKERARLRYEVESGSKVAADAAQLALEYVLVPVRKYYQDQGDRIAPGLVGLQAHEIKAAIDAENARELQRLARPVLEFTGRPRDTELDVLDLDPDQREPCAEAGATDGAGVPGAAED